MGVENGTGVSPFILVCDKYYSAINIIEQHLVPTSPVSGPIFMQDNAPYHIAINAENTKNLDLNPIENLWKIISDMAGEKKLTIELRNYKRTRTKSCRHRSGEMIKSHNLYKSYIS